MFISPNERRALHNRLDLEPILVVVQRLSFNRPRLYFLKYLVYVIMWIQSFFIHESHSVECNFV